MRFFTSEIVSPEQNSDVTLISTDGERFSCNPLESAMCRELIRLGAVSQRSLRRNILIPFCAKTVDILLGTASITNFEQDRSWFHIETCLEEIAGFAGDNREIEKFRDKLCDVLLETCSESNCFLLWKKFGEFASFSHAAKVLDFIKYSLRKMIKNKTIDPLFYRTNVDDLKALIEEEFLNVEKETDVLEIIESWISFDKREREKFRTFLYSSIRAAGLDAESYQKLHKQFGLSSQPARKTCDLILALGGWLKQSASQDIDWFNPDTATWHRSRIKLPTKLAYHGCAIVNDQLFVFGGSDGRNFYCDTWKLDNITFKWIECDNMFESRNFISNSSVVYNNKIYVFGGQDGELFDRPVRSKTAEYYDPVMDKWFEAGEMAETRSDCAAAVYKDRIFISGGYTGGTILRSVEIFNPLTNTFSHSVPLPTSISGHNMIVHNDQLYILGGFDSQRRLDTILMWHKESEWICLDERLQIGRSTFSACSYSGTVVAVGGYNREVLASCERILSLTSEQLYIPNILNKKSSVKVLVGYNWRKRMEAIGILAEEEMFTDMDCLIDHDETTAEQMDV